MNDVPTTEQPTEPLDGRDSEIVDLFAAGQSVADVASTLGLSASTVYRHLRRPAVRAALAATRAERWRPVADELRSGVSIAVRRLQYLTEHARQESTAVRAAVALVELALKLDELCEVKTRVAALEAILPEAPLPDNDQTEIERC